MEIFPLGHASFKIKGKQVTIVTDPYDSAMLGIKFPKAEMADIITVSHEHEDHNQVENVDSQAFVARGPGEYEVKGVVIVGVASFHDDSQGKERGKNTIFNLLVDEVAVCHLGDLGHKLSEEQVRMIGNVDVLLVPVGGFYTLSTELVCEVIAQLEPKIVIPMHYRTEKHNPEIFGQLESVDKFLKLMGVDEAIKQNKFSVTKDKLPETTTVIVLE